MSKLWLIEVKREIEDQYNFHMRQSTEPTQDEIFKALYDDGIEDEPDYCRWEVTEVVE